MRTEVSRWTACAVLALAVACSRPGADSAGDAQTPCAVPQGLAPQHHGGFCALPSDLRAFVSEHEAFKSFSGGEPADEAALQALAREHELRVLRERRHWAQLRNRYAADSTVSAWMRTYEPQEWP